LRCFLELDDYFTSLVRKAIRRDIIDIALITDIAIPSASQR
jgi:hypothetical protein